LPPVTGPLFDGDGDLEFFGPAWVAEARAFLTTRVAEKAASLKGVSFSLAEVATNPPSHLAPAGHTLGWAIYLEDGQLRVETGDRQDTEQRVEFDYEDGVEIGRIVYSKMKPEDLETMKRLNQQSAERATRAGKQPSSAPKVPPPLVTTLLKLHDHMAKRTMPRYHAYSPKWVAVARAFVERQARLPEVAATLSGHTGSFTFCEQVNGPPKHLSPDGSPIGFFLRIKDGQATAGADIPEQCDVKIYLDYATNCPVASYVYSGRSKEEMKQFVKTTMSAVQKSAKQENNPNMDKATAKLFGKLMAAGEVGDNALHDILARRTKSAQATLNDTLPVMSKL